MRECRCNGTGWVCENHPAHEWGKCPLCEGAGSPCICNPNADMPPGTKIIAQVGEDETPSGSRSY